MAKGTNVVILGAGVAGLTAALHVKEKLGDDVEVTVLEAADRSGGLVQSTTQDGFTWDNGSFVFSEGNYLVKRFPHLFEKIEDFREKVWLNNKLHPFPFKFKTMIPLFSVVGLGLAFIEYVTSNVKRSMKIGDKDATLETWLSNRMTRGLMLSSKLNVYLSKLQGRKTNELSYLLGTARLNYIDSNTRPKFFIKLVVDKLMRKKKKTVAKVYPKSGGIGAVTKELTALCVEKGVRIVYNAGISEITEQQVGSRYKIKWVGSQHAADFLISTIPLNRFVRVFKPAADLQLEADQLKFMDMQLSFFAVNKPKIMHKVLSIYSYDAHHPWKRLFARAEKSGVTSILVESTYDPETNYVDRDLRDEVLHQLVNELKLFEVSDLIQSHSVVVKKAYPIYQMGFQDRTNLILDTLENENLQFAGRQGRFNYMYSDKSVHSGIKAANAICKTITANSPPARQEVTA